MHIVLRVILTASIGLVVLVSGCDNDNAKKLLENKGSPFGQIGGDTDSKPQPNEAPAPNSSVGKAAPKNQPFGSLE